MYYLVALVHIYTYPSVFGFIFRLGQAEWLSRGPCIPVGRSHIAALILHSSSCSPATALMDVTQPNGGVDTRWFTLRLDDIIVCFVDQSEARMRGCSS